MKLSHLIAIRLSVVLFFVMTLWAILFYFAIIEEINDETDDSLEEYSELIILKFLRGENLPIYNNGTNNTYWVEPVTDSYANNYPAVYFIDSMIYLPEKNETEPARMMKTIFPDNQDNYYELTVSIPTIEKEDLKNSILLWIIILYLSLLLLVVLVNIILLYIYMNPLRKLLHWLDGYSIGKSNSMLINDTKIYEFKRLNETAVESIQRSEKIFEEQKTFIGNASHEMQTPLAVAMNSIELMINKENLSEETMNELFKINKTLQEAQKFNKTLLILSKIENKQFTTKEVIFINDIIDTYITDYRDIFGYKNITVQIIKESALYLTINKDLAVMLLTNLFRNAYIHNIQDGQINITITSSTIRIANLSSSESLDKHQIFERFYQKNKKSGSAGIGLAIVAAICKSENLICQYNYNEPYHTFEVSLSV